MPAIGAHPDDVEISSGRILVDLSERGYRCAVVILKSRATERASPVAGREPAETLCSAQIPYFSRSILRVALKPELVSL